jgi:hypothetical protein
MALIMIALVGGLSIYLAPSNALRLLIASLLVIPVVILLRLRLLDELSVEEGGDNLSLATDGSNPAHTERFKSATITGNRNQQGIDHDGAAQPPNP